ncbi:1-acyl-sn-glycerol-3-phosphate acyltransferase [Schistosoma japonicum]|nr:1-acyl-sn-glycerol-3-phosphate acyltransferase [Schistosoma japonicum]
MCLHILYYVGVIFACIPILYRIPKVQYYTKFTVFCLSILVGSFYYSIRLAFEGRRYENAWMFIKHLTFSGKLIGLNPVVENAQLLPKEPCIYVLNHQSLIDVASVGGIWPKRCAVVSKASLKFIGPLGLIIWLSRTITIDRSHHSDAISTMDKAAEAAKRDQVSALYLNNHSRFRFAFFLRAQGQMLIIFCLLKKERSIWLLNANFRFSLLSSNHIQSFSTTRKNVLKVVSLILRINYELFLIISYFTYDLMVSNDPLISLIR